MKYLFVLLSFFSVGLTHSQSIIYGFVVDSLTNERLPGVNVYEINSKDGTTTNSFGYFSFSNVPQDSIILAFSLVGYKRQYVLLMANNSEPLTIRLKGGVELSEVVVAMDRKRLSNPEIGVLHIPVKQFSEIPALMGEVDIMRAFQLMPGIHGGKEGTSGIYVRGGSADQNLILLDDIPLYYVNHIGGYVSVFNSEAIKNVELYKGGFPARYGGRLSSILDIRMKEGNMINWSGDFSVGLISSKFTIEGPLKKNKTSFLVSGRRSMFDMFTRSYEYLNSGGKSSAGYTLYDLNAKINHIINQRNRVFLSAYFGRDKIFITQKDYDTQESYPYNFKSENNINWGNQTVSFRWNHIYSNRLFSNLTLGYTKFFYNSIKDIVKIEKQSDKTVGSLSNRYLSSIDDLIFKMDFDYAYTLQQIKFGVGAIHHKFSPTMNHVNQFGVGSISIDTIFGANEIKPSELFIYFEDEILLTKKLSFNIGGHFNIFSTSEKTFWSIQPRLIGNLVIVDGLSLKLAYSRMSQTVHLLSNSDGGLPTDLWVPATTIAPPQQSSLFSLGLAGKLKEDIEWSVESYYKTFTNLIEFSDGASIFTGNVDWQEKIETNGIGSAFGVELLLQKKTGSTTGWLSYTISKNSRQFDNLNFGEPFPYKYDQRHNFSINLIHRFTEKFQLSGSWVFTSGNAVTLPSSSYEIYVLEWTNRNEGDVNYIYDEVHIYGKRNNYRTPAYHRLDINLSFTKQKKNGIRIWSFGVYNVYNHLNTYYLFYNYDKNGNRKLYSYSLFPIMPSVSYSYKF